MKNWIASFLFLIISVPAHATIYYVSTSGGGTTCSEASPCTMDGAVAKLTSGDEIIVEDGTYTASTMDVNVSAKTFAPRCRIRARNEGSWIMSGYSQAITIDDTVGLEIIGATIYNGSGSHSVYITDSSSCALYRVGVKNGTPVSQQYGNVIELSSLDGVTGSDDNLLEDVWVVGAMRYGILIGGTAGFSERNVLRRCVVRFDGGTSPEPKSGLVNYGATSGIDGARNNRLENCIAIDFNTGSSLYAGFYNPHEAVNIDCYGCISWKTYERGFLWYEDSGASGNDIFNSVVHLVNGGAGEGIVGSNASGNYRAYQVTVSSSDVGTTSYSAGTWISSFSFFADNTNNNSGTQTNNHYWMQTAAGTLSVSSNPTMAYYLRVEPGSAGYGNGTTTRRGADVTYRYGPSSSTYSDYPGSSHTAQSLWPFPYESRIHDLFAEADTGNWATGMPSNDEDRGFAAVGETLTDYLWEAFGNATPSFPEGGGQGGGGESPVSADRGKFKYRGSYVMRGGVRFQ